MKTKLIILFILLSCVSVGAQDKKSKSLFKGNNDLELLGDSITKMQSLIDSLQSVLVKKENAIALKDYQIDSLCNQPIVVIDGDSLLSVLRDSMDVEIVNRETRIQYLESKMGFVDTCMVKLANRWLYENFNKQAVEEAINYFDRIYSTQVKDDLSIVQVLLRKYENAYSEFQRIIKQAQGDSDRTNPFMVEEYKEKYISKIKMQSYYKEYYESDWNIRYLNEQIKKTLDRLNAHTSEKSADFSDLIDGAIY